MKSKYSVAEVAQVLELSKQTVLRHIKKGDLPAVKLGKSYIITRGDLEEYLGSRKRFEEIFHTRDTRDQPQDESEVRPI